MRRNGYQSRRLDKDVIWSMTRFGLDQDGPEVIAIGLPRSHPRMTGACLVIICLFCIFSHHPFLHQSDDASPEAATPRSPFCIAFQVSSEHGVLPVLALTSAPFSSHAVLSHPLNPHHRIAPPSQQVTGGLNVQQFLDKMYKRDPWARTDDLVVMPVRVSFMLRGVGLSLGHPVSTLHYWGPIANRCIADYEATHARAPEMA